GLASGTRQDPPPFVKPLKGPRFTYVDSSGSQTDVRVALPSVGEKDPLRPATELLVRVLDDGMSTRLFRTVVEDTGLAYETFGSFDPYEDIGLVVVGAAIEHGKTPS